MLQRRAKKQEQQKVFPEFLPFSLLIALMIILQII